MTYVLLLALFTSDSNKPETDGLMAGKFPSLADFRLVKKGRSLDAERKKILFFRARKEVVNATHGHFQNAGEDRTDKTKRLGTKLHGACSKVRSSMSKMTFLSHVPLFWAQTGRHRFAKGARMSAQSISNAPKSRNMPLFDPLAGARCENDLRDVSRDACAQRCEHRRMKRKCIVRAINQEQDMVGRMFLSVLQFVRLPVSSSVRLSARLFIWSFAPKRVRGNV